MSSGHDNSEWREEDDEDLDPDAPLSERDDPLPQDMDDPADDSAETVPCPYCGQDVYEQAEVCPHCGSYIVDEEDTAKPAHFTWTWVKTVATVLLVIVAIIVYFALGLL